MLHNSLQDATLGATADVPPSEIHILLVDDERLSRVVVSNLLKKCNYRGARGAPMRTHHSQRASTERVPEVPGCVQ